MALDADTGAYAWHYQTTPGEAWDYNSAMDMTLADLVIDGRTRKVLLHAPKNGFFYVIDRADGRLLSAEKFAKVTWAERVDLATAGPSWRPTRSTSRGGAALPQLRGRAQLVPDVLQPAHRARLPAGDGRWARATARRASTLRAGRRSRTPSSSRASQGDGDPPADSARSSLTAWDPVRARPAWRIETPGAHNSGTLATAGDLVFQDRPMATSMPMRQATAGASGPSTLEPPCSVRRSPSATGTSISPCCPARCTARSADGSVSAQFGWNAREHPRRLLAFALDAKASLPRRRRRGVSSRSTHRISGSTRRQSRWGSSSTRAVCCATVRALWRAAPRPIWRASPIPLDGAAFAAVVRNGSLESRGMPKFAELTDRELDALRHYIRYRARLATRGGK